MRDDREQIRAYVPRDLARRLRLLAEVEGLTMPEVLTLAVEVYLDLSNYSQQANYGERFERKFRRRCRRRSP